jgi:catechol 2,3-dioxygenase-like lactoylglutathione lyase family enzyme
MTVKRMDNVGIVVEDLDAAIEFFTELGLELEGRAPVEGAWAAGVTGLRDMRVEIAMIRTPDGHSRLELSRFLAPPVVADHRRAPVNALGYLRVMFPVEDLDDTLARLGKRGAELVGEVAHRARPTARVADFPGESYESGALRTTASAQRDFESQGQYRRDM